MASRLYMASARLSDTSLGVGSPATPGFVILAALLLGGAQEGTGASRQRGPRGAGDDDDDGILRDTGALS